MPAPELNPQTPGETPPDNTTQQQPGTGTGPATELEDDQPDEFMVKHNGGGRYIVVDADNTRVGDFTGGKEQAQEELQRLLDGGEPLDLGGGTPESPPARPAPKNVGNDPTTLKRAKLTPQGWLCPEPVVKE